MVKDVIIEQRLHERKQKLKQAQQTLNWHMVAFAVVNVGLWTLWIVAGSGLPWPLVITLVWGGIVYLHRRQMLASTDFEASKTDDQRREEILRELEKEREGRYAEERRDIYGYQQEEVPRIRFNEEGDETDSFIRDVKEFQQQRKDNQ